MRKALQITLVVVAAVVGGFIVLALFMDPKWEVQRETIVEAPVDKVFPYVSRLTSWPEWTVWNVSNYPAMKISHEGPEAGVGAVQRWTDGVDEGMIEITETRANQTLGYRVSMNKGEYILDGKIQFVSATKGTAIVWRVSGDAGANPIHRMFLYFVKPYIAQQIEENLSRLKEAAGKVAMSSGFCPDFPDASIMPIIGQEVFHDNAQEVLSGVQTRSRSGGSIQLAANEQSHA